MENIELKKERFKNRITELDLFRGIAVLLMIFDHIMYDLWGLMPSIFSEYPSALKDFAVSYWVWDVRVYFRFFVIFIFLSLTGISCAFSKSNLKRGLKLMGVALLLTLGTFLMGLYTQDMDNTIILFGVLHMIAFSIILIAILEKFTQNKWVYLAIGIVLVIVGRIIGDPVSPPLGTFSEGFFKTFFDAFIGKSLIGMDCFGFPFFGGQVFIGVFLGKQLYPERKPLLFKNGYKDNPITFVGRHALIVYVAHQFIVPVIIGLILLSCGYKLAL